MLIEKNMNGKNIKDFTYLIYLDNEALNPNTVTEKLRINNIIMTRDI